MGAEKRNQLKRRILEYPHVDLIHAFVLLIDGKEILQQDIGYIQAQRYDDVRSANGDLLDKIHPWLETEGHRNIYIYGALDTWSACAVRPTEGIDSRWFFLRNRSHGDARIKNMNATERESLITALEEWLSIDID